MHVRMCEEARPSRRVSEELSDLRHHPSHLMSSSLAKMMMPRALGVSMSRLITLLNSPGFGSLGILMDWAIQTPPGCPGAKVSFRPSHPTPGAAAAHDCVV